MFLRIKTPNYPLRRYVKSIIYYQNYTAIGNYEKLLPDGNSQLIIELDGIRRVVKHKTKDDNHFSNSWITGVQTKPVFYESEKNARSVVIQFENGGLQALTGIPAVEFKNQFVDSSLIFGSLINQLREKLLEAETVNTLLRHIIVFLEERVYQKESNIKFLDFLMWHKNKINMPIHRLSSDLGYSQKHCIELFKQRIGLSPKKYQRLLRFNKALSFLNSDQKPNYSDISYLNNYYDQAHFINDFKYFTDLNPSQYIALEREYPHVISTNTL
jgi:AraC-like DNA-binding protein